jgi:hypothetical protein
MPLFGTFQQGLNSNRTAAAPISPPFSPNGWNILTMYSGKKILSSEWTGTGNAEINNLRTAMGSPGTSTFMTMTEESTGADSRTYFDDGQGLYSSFFLQTNITKVALVDGSSTSLDPTAHTNHLVYDLVESTGAESIDQILKRLDIYQRDAAIFHGNDTVWGDPSVINHTAGLNGYSGLLTASSGTDFKAFTRLGVERGLPDRFCIMGINRASDNDIQALCAFWGDLNTGKGDGWRGANPEETFWSYWGHDFHTNSKTQRIGASLQTAPGVASQSTYTGNVYLMAFSPEA